MQIILTRKPGETTVRKDGYVVAMGSEAYRAAGLEVAYMMNRDRGKNSVLYIPIRDGGKSFGASLEDAFRISHIPYLGTPAFVSKRLRHVFSPTQSQLVRDIGKLRSDRPEYGVTAVIYDDTVDKGTRLLTMYGFLKDLQNDPRLHVDDIRLAAFMDSRGVTDYHALSMTDERVNKDAALNDLRSETFSDRLTETLYSFLPTKMQNPKDVVGRIMLL